MMHSVRSDGRRFFQFLLVVLSAGAIYPLVYLRSAYQEPILEVFQISLSDLNTIYMVLGFVFIAGYFPSGFLADRFSEKKLLVLSLIMTGIGGVWFALVPKVGDASFNFIGVVVAFVIWGVFSVFTFWGAHLKLVKLLAKKEEQGRFFGILDGGRGVIEAGLATVAAFIFTYIGSSTLALTKEALQYVIYMYAGVLFFVAFLVILFVDADQTDKEVADVTALLETPQKKFHFSDLLALFKNGPLLTLGIIIFMGYTVTWAYYYLGGFLGTNIGVSPETVATVMVISMWMRPVGGVFGGYLADRFGKANIVMSASLLSAISLSALALIPTSTRVIVFYVIVVLASLFIYTIRGTYWSLLGDCRVDNRNAGVSIGVVSLIGYLPDVLVPIVNTAFISSFGESTGYNAYFLWSAGMGLIAVILLMFFKEMTRQAVSQ